MDYSKVENMIKRMGSKAGLRGKVDAKCLSCIYDPQAPGNWRQQVSACTVTSCPLYSVRPQSKPENIGE